MNKFLHSREKAELGGGGWIEAKPASSGQPLRMFLRGFTLCAKGRAEGLARAGAGPHIPPKMLFTANNYHYLSPLWPNQTESAVLKAASCWLGGGEGRGILSDRGGGPEGVGARRGGGRPPLPLGL